MLRRASNRPSCRDGQMRRPRTMLGRTRTGCRAGGGPHERQARTALRPAGRRIGGARRRRELRRAPGPAAAVPPALLWRLLPRSRRQQALRLLPRAALAPAACVKSRIAPAPLVLPGAPQIESGASAIPSRRWNFRPPRVGAQKPYTLFAALCILCMPSRRPAALAHPNAQPFPLWIQDLELRALIPPVTGTGVARWCCGARGLAFRAAALRELPASSGPASRAERPLGRPVERDSTCSRSAGLIAQRPNRTPEAQASR